jgi:hypothetical protein
LRILQIVVAIRFGLVFPFVRRFRLSASPGYYQGGGRFFDFGGIYLVHVEDNLDVRESCQPGERLRGKLRLVKFDMNVFHIPIIIFHLGSR